LCFKDKDNRESVKQTSNFLKLIVSQVPLCALDIRSTINVVCKLAAYEERKLRQSLLELKVP